jgi:ATP-binding cassette subfamily A (ABC1) protein 3
MDKVDDFDINTVRIVDQLSLFVSHTIALLIKRYHYFKRDLRGFSCEILLPCMIVIVGLALMTITFISDSPRMIITANNFSWK